jgi:hypothetical protein
LMRRHTKHARSALLSGTKSPPPMDGTSAAICGSSPPSSAIARCCMCECVRTARLRARLPCCWVARGQAIEMSAECRWARFAE